MLNDFKKWMEEAGTSSGSVAMVQMPAGGSNPYPKNSKKKKNKVLEGTKNEVSPGRFR